MEDKQKNKLPAESRRAKRERLKAGIAFVLERALDKAKGETVGELTTFFVKNHRIARVLALRYAGCVLTALEGFPDGEIPADVLESHVDALSVHDESYARRLFHSDDLIVRALRGTATCVRRVFRWLDEGDAFTLAGRSFRAAAIVSERAGDVTEESARVEGMTSLAEWRRQWLDNLPRSAGTDVWSPDQACLRHDFVPEDLAPEK